MARKRNGIPRIGWVGIATSAILIPSVALVWAHIGRVWAAPREIEQVKEDQSILTGQTKQIGLWVEQQEKENELRKKAPPGFRWDEAAEEYVVYKDDPRLKKKK